MDLGATICTPKKPACALCPWSEPCIARKRGDQETFPRKTPKAEGKLRRGAAFVVTRADGALLVRTRPDKGLLAQMTEVPTTAWTHDFDEADALTDAPLKAKWHRVAGVVHHVFTHFPLELVGVSRTRAATDARAQRHALDRGATRSTAKPFRMSCARSSRMPQKSAPAPYSVTSIRRAGWRTA